MMMFDAYDFLDEASIEKRRGPRTEPCGTQTILLVADVHFTMHRKWLHHQILESKISNI